MLVFNIFSYLFFIKNIIKLIEKIENILRSKSKSIVVY